VGFPGGPTKKGGQWQAAALTAGVAHGRILVARATLAAAVRRVAQ